MLLPWVIVTIIWVGVDTAAIIYECIISVSKLSCVLFLVILQALQNYIRILCFSGAFVETFKNNHRI